MTDLEFLQGVRGILSAPNKWTQGRIARDGSGNAAAWNGDKATCWCLLGAGQVTTEGTTRERAGASLTRLLDLSDVVDPRCRDGFGERKPVLFNDDEKTTFDLVAKKLDEAIGREAAKQVPQEQAAAEPEAG